MPRQLWIADTLRAAGLKVVEEPGWRFRGDESFTPRGLVIHHTASGPDWAPGNLTRLLRDGRSDLRGPLCHVQLDRDGTCTVIASGLANHAGRGGWKNLTGNASVLGIEAANNGRGEPWPPAQIDAMRRASAALLEAMGVDETSLCGHKEWAPTRKIDPAGINMTLFRDSVASLLAVDDVDVEEDDVLFIKADKFNTVWAVQGDARVKLGNPREADQLDPQWRSKVKVLDEWHPYFRLREVS